MLGTRRPLDEYKFVQTQRKIETLENIVLLAENLTEEEDEEVERSFEALVKKYYAQVDEDDKELILFHELDSIAVDFEYAEHLQLISAKEDELKTYSTQVASCLKLKLYFLRRDLRQSFRNLIRFLFKNMNDESGDDDALLYGDRKQKSLTYLNFMFYGIRKDSQAVKFNTK